MNNRINKKIIPIRGMHCRSCEILIEDQLHKVPGIKKASVSHKKGEATIQFSGAEPDMQKITKAVARAGYSIGSDSKAFITKNPRDFDDLCLALFLLVITYFLLKRFGLFSLNLTPSNNFTSLPVVLLVGLTAGISTCMAMVGGLVLSISARHAEKHPRATPLQKFRPHLYFNLGRIIAFFFLGGLVGLIGTVFQLSASTLGILTILVGLLMLLLGIQLTGIFPGLNSGHFTLPKSISRYLGISSRHEEEYSHRNSLILGGLTFFLPCGFTQAMQLYAMSTGSFIAGALVMSVFALGTTPGLLSIGGLTAFIKGVFARRFFKFVGLAVIALAIFNISNGSNLLGLRALFAKPVTVAGSNQNTGEIVNGSQIIRMTQLADGYSPNQFTVTKGIPVQWLIDGQAAGSCSSSLVVPKLGIRKNLQFGENVIEFTPSQVGLIPFSCSMGMYTGTINVVDNSGQNNNSLPASTSNKSSNQNANYCVNNDSTATNNSIGPTNPAQSGQRSTKGGGCGCGGGAGSSCGGSSSRTQKTANPNLLDANSTADPADQIIRTTYTLNDDIVPNQFTVKAGQPVRLEITVKENGQGCMSTIMIPGLVNQAELLESGKNLVFRFTPQRAGAYDITCAMGVPRGTIIAQ